MEWNKVKILPAQELRDLEIEKQCCAASLQMANNFLRHLIVDGNNQNFNKAVREMADEMKVLMAKFPPPTA